MATAEKPLVEVKVTNPFTYLKNWWNKIVENEGVDFRFHITPLTAIVMTIIIASLGLGVGRFVIPPGINIPFFKYEDVTSPTPTATPSTWKETAYTGTLQFSKSTGKFYLMVTSSSELITLEVPENIDLTDYVGKRILAIGNYNKNRKILEVTDAKTLEVLPKTQVSIPTTTPTPSAEPTASPTPEASPSASPDSGL
ncbi:MAG: hypothetical protein NTV24_02565 [Candidatus Woesebacteria bacterium]|nr:hypothetical protein [Candidatus Woesebacteria bacterium]